MSWRCQRLLGEQLAASSNESIINICRALSGGHNIGGVQALVSRENHRPSTTMITAMTVAAVCWPSSVTNVFSLKLTPLRAQLAAPLSGGARRSCVTLERHPLDRKCSERRQRTSILEQQNNFAAQQRCSVELALRAKISAIARACIKILARRRCAAGWRSP